MCAQSLQGALGGVVPSRPDVMAPVGPVEHPGLRLIESSHAGIWLPEGFVGGHPVRDEGVMQAAIANRGSDWAKWFKEWHKTSMVDRRAAAALGNVLVAFDASAPAPELATELATTIILKAPAGKPNLTLREHTDHMVNKIAGRSHLEGVQDVTVNGRPASRVEYSGKTMLRRGMHDAHWLSFFIVTDVAAWNFGFVIPKAEAPAHLPTLLQCADTFEIRSEQLP